MAAATADDGRPGTKRPRSRRGRGEQLRQEILVAVRRLLAEWGAADRLTMRAVAKEVGISAPSIYLHFSDKTELLWAALADRYEELVGLMTAAASGNGMDARDQVRAMAHAYCLFALRNPGHYRLMFEVDQPPVAAPRIGSHPARHVSASFRTGFRGCREAGYELSLPVEQAAQTLWAGLHGMVGLHHSLFPDDSTEDLTLHLASGLLDSLVAGTTGPAPAFRAAPEETDASRRISALLSEQDPAR
ncbi:TetR/AcrR family transcriptional regulator [Streptomyces sp. NPDC001255]|uniref:TetR/AcrR family transcriptional regulator n=1 Tax=Streptomyces sp. NPDC001255 TaxID=3364550 RepID=UPI003699EA3D